MNEFFNYYIIGLLITLFFLILFGRRLLKINYDEPKTYATHDSWSSNAEAYVAWSMSWIIIVPVVILYFIYKQIVKLVKLMIKCFEQ